MKLMWILIFGLNLAHSSQNTNNPNKNFISNQFTKALHLFKGDQGEKDWKKVEEILNDSIFKYHKEAQNLRGYILYNGGYGLSQNRNEAILIWEQELLEDYHPSQYRLALALFYHEDQEKRDYKKVLDILKKPIFKMNKKSASYKEQIANINYMKGYILYHGGEGVPVDKKEAKRYLEHPSLKEHKNALFILGNIYSDGGDGIQIDKEFAISLWERAKRRGHVRARYQLAMAHLNGDGVPMNGDLAKDYLDHPQLKKDRNILYLLALISFYGKGGATIDRVASLSLFQQAHIAGHPNAQKMVDVNKRVLCKDTVLKN